MASSALQSTHTLPNTYSTPPPATPTTAPTQIDPLLLRYASFPAFYTLQPNLTTRARQLDLWTQLIRSHTSSRKIFTLNLSSPPADLFTLPSSSTDAAGRSARALKPADIRTVLDHMALPSTGSLVEWISAPTRGAQSNSAYIWWRSPGEWADLLLAWVEETGQRGTVLTLYELRFGDGAEGREWSGMDEGMLRKVLGVVVKKGRGQVFGEGGGEGVKFF